MGFQVDIEKTVRSAQRSFELRVRFETTARRTVIFGPSGSGKSLTLQALAGLLKPDRGRIAFGGEALFDSAHGVDMPARARGFGYLFQDYALFPKLNVRQNIAFALHRGIGNPSADVGGAAVDRWLATFELDEVASQRPDELSGGQRQRTALARALVNSPRALLLDEPFSALDPALRQRMRKELDELLKRIDIPVMMITHDPDDLEWFGDAALQLRDGTIAAENAPMKTSARNNFAGSVAAIRAGAINDEIELEIAGGLRIVATVTRESRDALNLVPGAKAFALVKASSIILVTEAEDVRLSARNQLAGLVTHINPGAINTEVVVDLPGGGSVSAVITNQSAKQLALVVGGAATAVFKASSVIVGVAAKAA